MKNKKIALIIIDRMISSCKALAIVATVLITAPESLPVFTESNNLAEAFKAIVTLIG